MGNLLRTLNYSFSPIKEQGNFLSLTQFINLLKSDLGKAI